MHVIPGQNNIIQERLRVLILPYNIYVGPERKSVLRFFRYLGMVYPKVPPSVDLEQNAWYLFCSLGTLLMDGVEMSPFSTARNRNSMDLGYFRSYPVRYPRYGVWIDFLGRFFFLFVIIVSLSQSLSLPQSPSALHFFHFQIPFSLRESGNA